MALSFIGFTPSPQIKHALKKDVSFENFIRALKLFEIGMLTDSSYSDWLSGFSLSCLPASSLLHGQ
jgi:hypothetical protein